MLRDQRRVDREDLGEGLAEAVDAFAGVGDVVGHVAEVALQFLVRAVLGEAGHQSVQHADEGAGGALELDHFTGEFVDSAGDLGVAAEDLGLDLVDVDLDARHHGLVTVDHRVQYRVEHRLRAEFEQLRGLLHAPAYRRQIGGRAMAHGDHEVGADEHMQLAEVDLLGRVEIARRAQDHEQGVAVALQLGPLVRLHRVFHREWVQVELGGQGEELGLSGAGEADPRHAGRLLAQLAEGLGEGGGGRDPDAVLVQGRLHDARHLCGIQPLAAPEVPGPVAPVAAAE